MSLDHPKRDQNRSLGGGVGRGVPRVIALFGAQGTGKGLIATRLAHFLAKQRRSVQRVADWREPDGVLHGLNGADTAVQQDGAQPEYVLLECADPKVVESLIPTITDLETLSVILVTNNTFTAVCVANDFCATLTDALSETGVRGLVISTESPTGEAAAFARAAALPVLACLPLHVELTKDVAETILQAVPAKPWPLHPSELLSIFEESLATGDPGVGSGTPEQADRGRRFDS